MIERVFPSGLRGVRPVVALIAILSAVAALLPASARAHAEAFASMGTGELNGVYYPVGKAICQIVNRDLGTHGVRCSPETTPGSVYNMRGVQSGELEFGLVQSDINFAAYKGEGTWTGRPFTGLRSVLSLYPELVTVMARADLHIQDLRAWQVNGSMSAAGVPAPGAPGRPSKRHSAGTTWSRCVQRK